jgi:glycine/D-amino acid oxidase-like deaminating enzyme
MRVGIIGGSIAGCATAALPHRADHDVTIFERSESGLVSRGAGIATPTDGQDSCPTPDREPARKIGRGLTRHQQEC